MARQDRIRLLAHRVGFAVSALLTVCLWPHIVRAQQTPVPVRPTPRAVPGELLVRLSPDFPACAHCVVSHGGSFKAVTGRRNLDDVRQRYGIREMEPVFGGPHADAAHARAQQRLGATPGTPSSHETPDLSQTYLVRVDPKTDLAALAAQLQRDPAVVLTEPNYLYKAFEAAAVDPALPNDPFLASSGSWGQDFPDLWGLFQIDAPTAWQTTQGEGVVVAVVDSGIDITHPDLAANTWTNSDEVPDNGLDDDGNGFVDDVHGWNFTGCVIDGSGQCEPTDQGTDISDPNGHGTHVAGIIAAAGDNGIGVIGVAPQAQVMAVRGLDENGDGSAANLAAAIVYAAENGAKVINASWGGGRSETIRLAIDYVTQVFDVVVVAAVDNENRPIEGGGSSPADLPRVLGVGATMHDGTRAACSFGGPLDLLAPGGGDSEPATAERPDRSILSTLAADSRLGQVCYETEGCMTAPWVVADQYARNGGTSMATAFVSGVAALVRSAHPDATRLGVRQALIGGADDVDPPGWDRMSGYGRLNARRAVSLGDRPVAEISRPDNSAKLRERDMPFPIFGTVSGSPTSPLVDWRLALRPEGGSGAPRELAQGYAPVEEAQLAVLGTAPDPGWYSLELTARDAAGTVTVDVKSVLVPDQRWVAVPVLDPSLQDGGNGTISRDGARLALGRGNRESGNADIDVFDISTRALTVIPDAQFPRLAPPDGHYLLYYPFLPSEGTGWVIRDNDDGTMRSGFVPGFFDANFPAVSADARRFAFVSDGDLDAAVGNPDRSWEAFGVEVEQESFRQLTSGPNVSGFDVQDLTMTPDGRYLAFVGRTDLDPNQPPAIGPRLYVYDFEEQQLHQPTVDGDPSRPLLGFAPSLSDDGRFIAYEANGVTLFDSSTQELTVIARGTAPSPIPPQISADGAKIGFLAAGDFDPRVTNEDLDPEVFLFDVASGRFEQVTDQTNYPFFAYSPVMDGSASRFLLTDAGFLNGTTLRPASVRLHPRRGGPNANPVLVAPSKATIREGLRSHVALRATDADGDPLTFFVQSTDPLNTPPPLANSVQLVDRGDGTADLSFEPRRNEQGTYRLTLAVFDEAGGIAQQRLTLTVLDDLIEGDANCDGELDDADRRLLAHIIFDPTFEPCGLSDANGDGKISAADLAAVALGL